MSNRYKLFSAGAVVALIAVNITRPVWAQSTGNGVSSIEGGGCDRVARRPQRVRTTYANDPFCAILVRNSEGLTSSAGTAQWANFACIAAVKAA